MTRPTMLAALAALPLAALPPGRPAGAMPQQFTLAPGPAKVEFRAYGLGLISFDGQFTRFAGHVTLDDTDPSACAIAVKGETGSLTMSTSAMTQEALGPSLLDAGASPEFLLDGTCRGGTLSGTLLLHGVRGPVTMQVERRADRLILQGTIDRRAFGMSAKPLLAGPEVRLTITAGMPAGFGPAPRR